MTRQRPTTGAIMAQVMLATIPGLLALVWHFGAGVLLNVLLAVTAAILAEAVAVSLRGRAPAAALGDGSAVVTGLLLGLALPPFLPAELTVLGAALAIILGKQVYGGLGQNPFNPAMVGYAILLVSFPVEMTNWALPRGIVEPAGLVEAARVIFGLVGEGGPDAWTGATPLDDFRHREGLTTEEWRIASGLAGQLAGRGWEWVNLAFLAGGLYLMVMRRLFTWHAPVAMLATLALASAVFWDGGSSQGGGSPLFHLLSGATMLGAFFIVTEPVSSATSPRGRLLFGAGVGLLLYVIRVWGNHPDALAFAILLMNAAAPAIDRATRPRPHGQEETLP